MAKPNFIELGNGEQIPILFEDRSVIAIDKPPRWMLVPFNWQKTDWNLQAAITSSIAAGDYWARSRNLRSLRYVHRLDADTSGILLFAKSTGAVETYSGLFESRSMAKVYLAVVDGAPKQAEWACHARLAPDPAEIGRMMVDPREGKESETGFRVLQTRRDAAGRPASLIEARPVTGRTHQIRVHLAESGHPVMGDEMYGVGSLGTDVPLALRAVKLAYFDPFTKREVRIAAPVEEFLKRHQFEAMPDFHRRSG